VGQTGSSATGTGRGGVPEGDGGPAPRRLEKGLAQPLTSVDRTRGVVARQLGERERRGGEAPGAGLSPSVVFALIEVVGRGGAIEGRTDTGYKGKR